MSIYLSNSAEVSKSQINFSPAKQTFSFSKSERFPQIKPYCSSHFYAAKEGVSFKTGTCIGYGTRVTFENKRITYHQKELLHLTNINRNQTLISQVKRICLHLGCLEHQWLRYINKIDVFEVTPTYGFFKARPWNICIASYYRK